MMVFGGLGVGWGVEIDEDDDDGNFEDCREVAEGKYSADCGDNVNILGSDIKNLCICGR